MNFAWRDCSFGLLHFLWEARTFSGSLQTDAAWLRLLSGIAAGIVVFVIFPILLEWLQKRELEWARKQSDAPSAQSSA